MHHKRRRPRNRRAGCKLCKPWKVNGYRTERPEAERFGDHRRRTVASEAVRAWQSGFEDAGRDRHAAHSRR